MAMSIAFLLIDKWAEETARQTVEFHVTSACWVTLEISVALLSFKLLNAIAGNFTYFSLTFIVRILRSLYYHYTHFSSKNTGFKVRGSNPRSDSKWILEPGFGARACNIEPFHVRFVLKRNHNSHLNDIEVVSVIWFVQKMGKKMICVHCQQGIYQSNSSSAMVSLHHEFGMSSRETSVTQEKGRPVEWPQPIQERKKKSFMCAGHSHLRVSCYSSRTEPKTSNTPSL